MMKPNLKYVLVAGVSAAVTLLSGCGTSMVSKDINDEGRVAQAAFPDIAKNNWTKEGTFPNLDNLRRIAPNVTKDELYELVGRPHFSEGLFGVREWDYVFKFQNGQGQAPQVCQYKVIFDKNMLGQSFLWQPAACAEQLVIKAAALPPERVVERIVERVVERIVERPAAPMRFTLAGDALFTFNRSSLADLLPGGISELEKVANGLQGGQVERVEIIGHADRLGSAPLNQQLSAARADTVRQYLMGKVSLPATSFSSRGAGQNESVTNCTQKNTVELINCLAPDRRVEIRASIMPTR